jgi:nucleotide-binding universal stress UspA family protein
MRPTNMNTSKRINDTKALETTPRRILVPVDFSPPSRKAAAAAVELVKRFDAKLALVHVTGPKGRPGSYAALEVVGMTTDPRRPAREKLAEFANKEVPADIDLTRLVESGAAYHQIAKAASDWDADLILIATHGYTGLAHALLGSTAERVVRHAPCPVLVMRGREKRGVKIAFSPDAIHTILLTTDFSENSLAAFPQAAAWACEFGSKLILLYVVPEHLPAELSQIGVVLHEKHAAQEAEKQLPEFARAHLPAGLPVETRVLIGPPEHTICETARKLDAALVVMGSHGHTGFNRLMVGSVAERVVQHAPCAVLVIREQRPKKS